MEQLYPIYALFLLYCQLKRQERCCFWDKICFFTIKQTLWSWLRVYHRKTFEDWVAQWKYPFACHISEPGWSTRVQTAYGGLDYDRGQRQTCGNIASKWIIIFLWHFFNKGGRHWCFRPRQNFYDLRKNPQSAKFFASPKGLLVIPERLFYFLKLAFQMDIPIFQESQMCLMKFESNN